MIGFIAVVWNDTHDYTYATYLVSMWVWVSGAYVVICTIRGLHGGISVGLTCNYLIAVCAAQCLIALAMDQYPPLKHFVDGFLGSTGFMGKMEDRIYGIGASLDVAGSRFSAALIMIVPLLTKSAGEGQARQPGVVYDGIRSHHRHRKHDLANDIGGRNRRLCYLPYASRIHNRDCPPG